MDPLASRAWRDSIALSDSTSYGAPKVIAKVTGMFQGPTPAAAGLRLFFPTSSAAGICECVGVSSRMPILTVCEREPLKVGH